MISSSESDFENSISLEDFAAKAGDPELGSPKVGPGILLHILKYRSQMYKCSNGQDKSPAECESSERFDEDLQHFGMDFSKSNNEAA